MSGSCCTCTCISHKPGIKNFPEPSTITAFSGNPTLAVEIAAILSLSINTVAPDRGWFPVPSITVTFVKAIRMLPTGRRSQTAKTTAQATVVSNNERSKTDFRGRMTLYGSKKILTERCDFYLSVGGYFSSWHIHCPPGHSRGRINHQNVTPTL